uniref:Uncharacterized protein n=1 Tax=Oryza glaberrima TaxID=4538 RepID=I1Q5G0_ORYGL
MVGWSMTRKAARSSGISKQQWRLAWPPLNGGYGILRERWKDHGQRLRRLLDLAKPATTLRVVVGIAISIGYFNTNQCDGGAIYLDE